MSRMSRRKFVGRCLEAATVATALPVVGTRRLEAASAADKVVLALIGSGGRGQYVARGLAEVPGVEFKYVCDLEESRAAAAAKRLGEIQKVVPRTTKDMRTVFDDRDVHGVVVATPEQWHALASIWACQAGKDVYVEKCISRHVEEGRKMIEAARKYRRIVQAGTQHRSGPYMVAARDYIRAGKLGEVFYVKVCNMLPSVYGGYPFAAKPDSAPPAGFDWDQWLGPAPVRPYNVQVHRNWHGWWDYSGGNSSDGIHQLDQARMLLGEPGHPQWVSCMGGRVRYNDGGEMPDLQIVNFQWDKLTLSFENTGFSPVQIKAPAKIQPDAKMPNWLQSSTRIEVYGTQGTMYVGRHFLGWQVLVPGSKITAEQFEENPDTLHFRNFVECIRTRRTPNADVEPGHMAACLEHLGNISYRLGNQKLHFDGQRERFVGNPAADAYLTAAARGKYRIPDAL